MMVKVLVYGNATGTFSSRKLEEEIAFRMLAAGNFPQHLTLCESRRRHLKDFGAVFAEVVRLARGGGSSGAWQGLGGRDRRFGPTRASAR